MALHNESLFLAIAGVGAHLFYWIREERSNKEIRRWLYSHFAVNSALLLALTINRQPGGTVVGWNFAAWVSGAIRVLLLNIWFYGPLFASVLVYRAFFHRLHNFPGPFSLKLSKLVAACGNIEKDRDFERVWNLHKKYGDIVRIGPQELSVLHADAIDAIYGPSSRCTRAPWYDRLKNTEDYSKQDFAVFHMRDPVAHAKRRKAVWDKAFNIKALKSYQPMIIKVTDEFLDALSSRTGQPLSGPDTIQLLSYDLMGVIGWGQSFHNIENWTLNPNLHFVKAVTAGQQIISQAPWLMNLLINLPGADGPLRPYGKWISARIQEKLQNPGQGDDAMSKIVQSMDNLSKPALYSEGELMVIAGGDTTSTTISTIVFHLAKYPTLQCKLQAELDEAQHQLSTTAEGDNTSETDEYYRSISSLPYLNACINEALRIQPPVQGGIPRKTPAEGLHLSINNEKPVFIPGDTIISVPTLPVQRDPRFYVHPDDFIPERWTHEKQVDLTINKAAFMPFAGGVYTCAGRGLAYIEMRIAVAKLFSRFDARLAEGEDGRKFLEETKDCHVAHLGDYQVIFTERVAVNA